MEFALRAGWPLAMIPGSAAPALHLALVSALFALDADVALACEWLDVDEPAGLEHVQRLIFY